MWTIFPRNFCEEYLALQNCKKYLIFALKLSLNEGNFAIRIDSGDRQTDKVSYRGAPLQKIVIFSINRHNT